MGLLRSDLASRFSEEDVMTEYDRVASPSLVMQDGARQLDRH